MEMPKLLALVGKGKKLARDLSAEQAQAAFQIILEGKASLHQVGAFLMAMRMKGETAAELAAFTTVAEQYGRRVEISAGCQPLSLPAYAGKRRTFHATPASALVMAAAGVPVIVHGFGGAAGKIGAEAVLAAAGVPVDVSPAGASALLAETGFAYVGISQLNPMLYRLLLLRAELGVRTVVNTMLRIYDPAGAGRHLIGITHPPYLDLLAGALLLRGARRALLFRGIEGESEIALTAEVAVTEVSEGGRSESRLELGKLGVAAAPKAALVGGGPEEEAKRLGSLLRGRESGPHLDSVLLNAAAGIYAGGRVASVSEGIVLAREALCSGAAELVWDRVRERAKGL